MVKRIKHKFRKDFLYYCARALLAVARLIPAACLYLMGSFSGWCSYYVLARERKKTLANLSLAFAGEKGESERKRIARGVFVNLGRNLAEFALYSRLDDSGIHGLVSMEGRDILDRVLAEGKGILIITGHIGNWELIPAFFIATGYSGGVVARRIYYDRYNELLFGLRRSRGFRVFYRDESPKKILRTLRNNEVVGILADQDVRKLPGVFVEFFGRQAYTPTAPVLIAQKSGAPLCPARIIREGRKHRIVIEEPLDLRSSGDKEDDLIHNTQLWSRAIERYIRERPDQWVWMHRRWRTQPEDIAAGRRVKR